MAINYTINENIQQAPFEVLCGKNILFLVDLLLSRESSIKPRTYKFASKIKQLVNKVKSMMHSA